MADVANTQFLCTRTDLLAVFIAYEVVDVVARVVKLAKNMPFNFILIATICLWFIYRHAKKSMHLRNERG